MSTKKLQILDYTVKQADNADTVDGKHAANFASATDMTTAKSDISNLQSKVGNTAVSTQISTAINAIDYPVDSVNGKTGAVKLTASDVGALPSNTTIPSIDGLATRTYVDNKVAGIVNSAPETLDTLNELATALGNDPNFATTVATEIGTKVDKVSGKGLSTNDYTTTEKNKLSGIAAGAEVNQNAFSNVTVGTTTIAADGKTDTLTIAAGSNITLTPDVTNDKITIAATDTVYTHPSYTARTGVPTANATPAFGGTFKVSQPVSDATGHITKINSRTITIPSSTATTSAAGLMSASDKIKLNAINEYLLEFRFPNTGSSAPAEWGYRKWNSGYLECFLRLPVSGMACSTAVGNWYRTGTISFPNYPIAFGMDPVVNMYFETTSGTGGIVWSTGTSTSTPTVKPVNVYIIRMVSATSITGWINIYAAGTWDDGL